MNEQRVYKYEISPSVALVEMPKAAEILSAAFQGQTLMVWAKVFPDTPIVKRRFHVAPTGHDLPNDFQWAKFVGTVFLGSLVFHVWDYGEVRP